MTCKNEGKESDFGGRDSPWAGEAGWRSVPLVLSAKASHPTMVAGPRSEVRTARDQRPLCLCSYGPSHPPSTPSIVIGKHVVSILNTAAEEAGVDSEWVYLCDFKVQMASSKETKTLMLFADGKCPLLDVSWVARDWAEAAAAREAAAAAREAAAPGPSQQEVAPWRSRSKSGRVSARSEGEVTIYNSIHLVPPPVAPLMTPPLKFHSLPPLSPSCRGFGQGARGGPTDPPNSITNAPRRQRG